MATSRPLEPGERICPDCSGVGGWYDAVEGVDIACERCERTGVIPDERIGCDSCGKIFENQQDYTKHHFNNDCNPQHGYDSW